MTTTLQEIVEKDAQTLLERALLNKQVCAFGEDGFGKYGRNTVASWFTVSQIRAFVLNDPHDPNNMKSFVGSVAVTLDGYDASVSGHIMTDKNFEIRLSQLLTDSYIDPACLAWPEVGATLTQGRHFVVMTIDLGKLLEWL